MKTPSVIYSLALSTTLSFASTGFVCAQSPAPSPAVAASVAPKASDVKTAPMKQKVLDKYDTNHNGKIDPEEKAAIENDHKARKAEKLKKYDKNGDGKLDDEERAAMKADRKLGK